MAIKICYYIDMRTKAIIHLDRYLSNFQAVRARIGEKIAICVPVKANAYGHGALEIAKASLEAGALCLGVATAKEGAELREGGIDVPILLMSQPHPEDIPAITDAFLSPFISDSWFTDALNEQAEMLKSPLPVHLKIDTGMGRIGCTPEEAPSLARHIAGCEGLELVGTATHFAVSDSTDPKDIAYTQRQLSCFKEAVNTIRDAGVDPGIIHAANSGAVILHPESWFDMVRPGILLYGYKAADESKVKHCEFEPLQVKPVMELRTIVTLIKKVKKGETVSYGRTWTAASDTNIAVLPIGYNDGLPRLASGKWQAVINGNSYPVAGKICMDLCCIDIGNDSNVHRWDEAVIFGGPARDAGALAAAVGTIPYEITCNVSERVPRIYEE